MYTAASGSVQSGASFYQCCRRRIYRCHSQTGTDAFPRSIRVPSESEQGQGIIQDAAQKGHWDAQYDYAWMCRHGLGGGRDIDDALKYFEMGAQKGHFLCMAELATLYQEPTAYRNYQKAFEWAKRATDTGDPLQRICAGESVFLGKRMRI